MAGTSAGTVRVRSKAYLPGVGFDANGAPVARKQVVRGRIVGTGYNDATGLVVTPASFGLKVLDSWAFGVVSYSATTSFGGDATNTQPTVLFNPTSGAIWVVVQPGAVAPIGTDTAYELSFEVSGDSLDAPELT